MLMMDEGWSSRPLTTSQLQEFERQTLVFNYMVLGIPVPSHLVLPFKRSYSSDPFSLHPSSKYLLHFCSLPFVLLTETVISSFGSEFWEESRGRSGTMEVQKNRWEEVEVLQRRLGGLQILREAQAQGQEVFNKDRGNAFAHQPILQLLLAHLFIFVILHFYTIGLALGSSISLVRRGQRALQWTGECR